MQIDGFRPPGAVPWEEVRGRLGPALSDVRKSRGGRYAEVMVERIKELGLTKPRIGLVEIDPRHKDYLPVNQYNDLRDGLPDAEIVFTRSFIHELVVIKSEPELECVRRAGVLCQRSEEHTSELQSHLNLVCRLLLEKKKKTNN